MDDLFQRANKYVILEHNTNDHQPINHDDLMKSS